MLQIIVYASPRKKQSRTSLFIADKRTTTSRDNSSLSGGTVLMTGNKQAIQQQN